MHAEAGYKDWSDGTNHFETLDFTRDTERFMSFVEDIRAKGGGDAPEDVLGGLQRAVHSLTWPDGQHCNILFHLGDAPPHGEQFTSGDDDYPGGHPSDPSPADLFAAMTARGILVRVSACDLNGQRRGLEVEVESD